MKKPLLFKVFNLMGLIWIFAIYNGYSFPANVSVTSLNGNNGFSVSGKAKWDESGISIGKAGDVNGDGINDFIIGAQRAAYNHFTNCGQAYVVFGSFNGFPADLKLSTLNGANGFAITPMNSGSNLYFGASVSGAGDVNGDGLADIIIGAPESFKSTPGTGKAYVIFGKPNGFPANMDDNQLNGTNGFIVVYTFNSNNVFGDSFGYSVSGGDLNNDGLADIIIGAPIYRKNLNLLNDGRGYVIFGKTNGFPASFNVSALNGTNGFTITGYHDDQSGYGDVACTEVKNLGDVNGDKIDDVIIGTGNDGMIEINHCYVIFGKKTAPGNGFPVDIELKNLDGINGFTIWGENMEDGTGWGVGRAGDVNGDGINDIITSVLGFFQGNIQVGKVCVIFGHANFPSNFYIGTLNGANGFAMVGVPGVVEGLGYGEVSGVGDINADGFDDIIVSPPDTAPVLNKAFVVFGLNAFPSTIPVNQLNGNNGFIISKQAVLPAVDGFGNAETEAGDVNGDGVDDLIISAYLESPQNITNAGKSYVIYGESPVVGDMNNDKQADLILQKDNYVLAALMTNGIYTGVKLILIKFKDPAEKVIAVNDFNLDGKTDLATQSGTNIFFRQGPNFGIIKTLNFSGSFLGVYKTVVASGNLRGQEVKGKQGYPDLVIRAFKLFNPNYSYYYVMQNSGNWNFGAEKLLYSDGDTNLFSGCGFFLNKSVVINRYSNVLIQKTDIGGKPIYANNVTNLNGAGAFLTFLPNSPVLGAANFKVGTGQYEMISTNGANVYIGVAPAFSGYTLLPGEKVVGPK